jgi:hypothetical protein
MLWVFRWRCLLGIVSLPIEEIRIDSLRVNVSNASSVPCTNCDLPQCISNGHMQEEDFVWLQIPIPQLLHRALVSP